MASKIKNFNFSGCQHLRKVLINVNVETEGEIDLSETPLKDRNDINNVDEKFKNIPNGITASVDFLRNKVKLEGDSEKKSPSDKIGDLEDENLSFVDKKFANLMRDNLFWYNTAFNDGDVVANIEYLEQRNGQLKDGLNSNIGERLNKKLRLLAEHILFINEKILINSKYFESLNNITNYTVSPFGDKKWTEYYEFLLAEVLDQDGIIYKLKDNLSTEFKIDPNNLSQDALDRFMNSLEATLNRDGYIYYTFPNYDEDWLFKDYYNNDTRFIGIKPFKSFFSAKKFVEKKISDSGEEVLRTLFNYWKDNR